MPLNERETRIMSEEFAVPYPEPAAGHGSSSVPGDILNTAEALRAARPAAVGVAFWDFDGTVFDGDCTEGFGVKAGGLRIPGMVAESMKHGFAADYADADGFARCWRQYQDIMRHQGIPEAYAYIVRIFKGARPGDILDLARRRFAAEWSGWFFPEALEIWNTLESAGVRNVVISASADFFVKGAAANLGVPESRLHGVRLVTDADGVLTDVVVPPLTCAEGKAERMSGLLAEMAAAEPGREFHPVAAFGNHIVTDGPLLAAVARSVLPAGRPLGVLINCGPASGIPLFHHLTFSRRSIA